MVLINNNGTHWIDNGIAINVTDGQFQNETMKICLPRDTCVNGMLVEKGCPKM
jgi:hypothetical protein